MDGQIYAAFRSRNHTLKFLKLLEAKRVKCNVVSTPSQIAIGCGLSVVFLPANLEIATDIVRTNQLPIIGFYKGETQGLQSRYYRIGP